MQNWFYILDWKTYVTAMGLLLQCQALLAKGHGGEWGKSLGSGKQVIPFPEGNSAKDAVEFTLEFWSTLGEV